ERAQEHGIDDGEDRSVRADTQSQRENSNQSEARLLHQHSRAVAQILPDRLHNSSEEIHPQSTQRSAKTLFPLREPSCGFVEKIHPHRRAISGSTFVARRAGIQQARRATAVSNIAIAA